MNKNDCCRGGSGDYVTWVFRMGRNVDRVRVMGFRSKQVAVATDLLLNGSDNSPFTDKLKSWSQFTLNS